MLWWVTTRHAQDSTIEMQFLSLWWKGRFRGIVKHKWHKQPWLCVFQKYSGFHWWSKKGGHLLALLLTLHTTQGPGTCHSSTPFLVVTNLEEGYCEYALLLQPSSKGASVSPGIPFNLYWIRWRGDISIPLPVEPTWNSCGICSSICLSQPPDAPTIQIIS